jgi:hypothetical protein
MLRSSRIVVAAAGSLCLVTTSTASVASTMDAAPRPTNSWLMLSMLTPSGAAVLSSTEAALAQPEAPPPPPPQNYDGNEWPPIPVILIWLAVLGVDVYILTKHHHHGVPNSPA